MTLPDFFNKRLANTELGYMEASDKCSSIDASTLFSNGHTLRQAGIIFISMSLTLPTWRYPILVIREKNHLIKFHPLNHSAQHVFFFFVFVAEGERGDSTVEGIFYILTVYLWSRI